jgi:pyruvate/2-oxoglutarate dehydrogenase complex dihydrolipoamide acyltransferase (E2) component
LRRLVVLLICACALPVSDASAWTWPVAGPVLRPFSFDQAHPYAAGQHRGIDVGAPSGSPVRAPAQGVVSFAGTVPTGGKTVSIQTPFGYTGTLVHLGSIGVTRGEHVDEGSVVGTVGPSGTAEPGEPYVYFGLRTTSDEQGYVDPLTFLPPGVVSAPPPVSAVEQAAAPAAIEAVAAAAATPAQTEASAALPAADPAGAQSAQAPADDGTATASPEPVSLGTAEPVSVRASGRATAVAATKAGRSRVASVRPAQARPETESRGMSAQRPQSLERSVPMVRHAATPRWRRFARCGRWRIPVRVPRNMRSSAPRGPVLTTETCACPPESDSGPRASPCSWC